MVTKEEFNKVWKDSTKENILNQFYYEHIAIRKAIEYINTHKVSDTITFPLMKREQENQVKSCFDYEFEQVYKKDLLNILQNGSEKDE